jgi:hypothetical protein
MYQNGKNNTPNNHKYTKGPKYIPNSCKRTKWSYNITTSSIARPYKVYPNRDFFGLKICHLAKQWARPMMQSRVTRLVDRCSPNLLATFFHSMLILYINLDKNLGCILGDFFIEHIYVYVAMMPLFQNTEYALFSCFSVEKYGTTDS